MLSTGNGAIEITGTAAAGSRGISLSSTADSVGGAAATGNILLHAKSGRGMVLGGLIQTTGNLTLRAEGGGAVTQPDGNIRVGGLRVLGDSNATFALNQTTNNVAVLAGNVSGATANLSYTDTDGFQIGTVTAPDVAGGTANTTSGLTIGSAASATNTITLIAGGAVTQATGNAIVTGGLRLSGAGNYSLTEATNNISTLAANHTGGLLRYTDAGNFTVGTVNGVAGINVGTNNVTLTTQAGGTITQANSIVAGGLLVSGAGNFDLRHVGNNVSVFAASANGGNSYFHDLDGFNVAVVDGVGGISVGAANNITLSAGNATTLGTVTQGNAIIAGGLELLSNVSYTLTHATNNIGTLSANVTGALTYHDSDSFHGRQRRRHLGDHRRQRRGSACAGRHGRPDDQPAYPEVQRGHAQHRAARQPERALRYRRQRRGELRRRGRGLERDCQFRPRCGKRRCDLDGRRNADPFQRRQHCSSATRHAPLGK